MGTMLAEPAVPPIEAALMIFPLPCPTTTITASRAVYKTPCRSTSITLCQEALVISCAGAGGASATPALLTRMSKRPNSRTVVATVVATCCSSATSHAMLAARRPCFTTAAAVCAAASGSRSTQAMSAPASARASANSLPSPPPAPVTRATLPVRSNSSGRDTGSPGGRGELRSPRLMGPVSRSSTGRIGAGCPRGTTGLGPGCGSGHHDGPAADLAPVELLVSLRDLSKRKHLYLRLDVPSPAEGHYFDQVLVVAPVRHYCAGLQGDRVQGVAGRRPEGELALPQTDQCETAPRAHDAAGDIEGRGDADEVEDNVCTFGRGAHNLADVVDGVGARLDRVRGAQPRGQFQGAPVHVHRDHRGGRGGHEDLHRHVSQATDTDHHAVRAGPESISAQCDGVVGRQSRIGERGGLCEVEIARTNQVRLRDDHVVRHA